MKYVYVVLGILCFGLGVVGVVLPVLPTTPFLLLASFFLLRGSRRFHDWLVGTKLYQKHVVAFKRERSMSLKMKVIILGFATTMLLVAFFMMENVIGRIVVVGVILMKYYYFVFRIGAVRNEEEENKVCRK